MSTNILMLGALLVGAHILTKGTGEGTAEDQLFGGGGAGGGGGLFGPGGLFGLVHAHLVCAISNTTYYEYFPNGSRDARGREIGLLNPPLPENGQITPPYNPGWGAEWDWAFFKKKRVGEF